MEEHEILNNEYFKVNRFLLKLTGLWPYQKRHVKLIIRILYICAIHSMMIPQVIRTVEEWGKDFEIVLENIVGFIYLQCVLAKYVITFMAEPQLVFLYKKMALDWTRYIEAEEQLSLQRAASNGQLMTIIYSVYVNFAGVGFATLPGTLPTILNIIAPLNESRPTKVLCFYAEYFIDQEEYYYQLLFQTFIGVMSTVFINATVDTLYVICAHHSDGLFNIVSYRFQKAFNKSQERYQLKSRNLVAAKNLDEEIHEYVLTAINIHNESIEYSILHVVLEFTCFHLFINLIQSTYTLYFFIQMSLTIISLSLATVVVNYHAMMNLDDIINLIRIFFIWCGIILNLAYISIAGQQIIDTSLQIFDSAYFCGWYNHPLKTQRLLKFIMLRCSRQCQITAGPMLVINLESCSNILKSSLSYCTFMIAVS
ncbi:hypothetical protein TSAR_000295 [Trichomalopsis sarcophagae]|uniref:Odorant receptor n=1 Tax=Trichomalopsis sarcophagae TaxID=543379 RepID=A0A232FF80_9HYME|nr:hypothetical protein TSAR_000295 [Trichomalopsis sarcophagae]